MDKNLEKQVMVIISVFSLCAKMSPWQKCDMENVCHFSHNI